MRERMHCDPLACLPALPLLPLPVPPDDISTTSSHKSVELINKLAPLVKPMLLEWEQISCIYNTAKGSKNVLTVSG
jgi:hypothetical protein